MVSGGKDGGLQIWDVDTGDRLGAPITRSNVPATGVAFTPDAKRAVVGSQVGTIRLWDLSTRQPVGAPSIRQQTGVVSAVAVSPDGHRVVSADANDNLNLWDADTGQLIGAPMTGHTGTVTALAFSRTAAALSLTAWTKPCGSGMLTPFARSGHR